MSDHRHHFTLTLPAAPRSVCGRVEVHDGGDFVWMELTAKTSPDDRPSRGAEGNLIRSALFRSVSEPYRTMWPAPNWVSRTCLSVCSPASREPAAASGANVSRLASERLLVSCGHLCEEG